MTSQEQQMIQGLIDRVNQTQLPEKDHDAEQLLQQNLGRNPDAIYILSQTVIVQDYALQQAQRQLADTRAQLEATRQQQAQPQQHTSFLGSLLGHKDNPAPPPAPARSTVPPPPAYQPVTPSYGQPQPPAYAPVPNSYAPGPSAGFGAPAGGGGFLRGAMQTAAGVAAGALAFEGIESLMHGFGGGAGYGAAGLGGFGGGAPREEVINNYYGDSGDRDSADRDSGGRSDFDTAAEDNGTLSPDLEDRRFSDGGDDQSGSDATGFDDSSTSDSLDNGSGDDGGSFGDDGSGGFDGGSGDDSSFS